MRRQPFALWYSPHWVDAPPDPTIVDLWRNGFAQGAGVFGALVFGLMLVWCLGALP